jgi:hypothetical protein
MHRSFAAPSISETVSLSSARAAGHGLVRVPMVRAYSGGARDDLGHLFNDLNDGVHDAGAAGHRIKFANRQFAGFAIEHFVVHVSLLFVGGDDPLMHGGTQRHEKSFSAVHRPCDVAHNPARLRCFPAPRGAVFRS